MRFSIAVILSPVKYICAGLLDMKLNFSCLYFKVALHQFKMDGCYLLLPSLSYADCQIRVLFLPFHVFPSNLRLDISQPPDLL